MPLAAWWACLWVLLLPTYMCGGALLTRLGGTCIAPLTAHGVSHVTKVVFGSVWVTRMSSLVYGKCLVGWVKVPFFTPVNTACFVGSTLVRTRLVRMC